MIARLLYALRWTTLVATLAIGSLFVAWHALATADFGYSLWYDALAIDATIEVHGPQNTIRPGFEETDRSERERLFGGIVEAIHADGEGLEALTYHAPDGTRINTLLTAPEILHLQDVAALINAFTRVSVLAIGVFALLLTRAFWRREAPPAAWWVAAGCGAVLLAACGAVAMIGPVAVFYWLHEVLFPPDHEWFFYYQESLMSMMMQAPNLFGPIAALWLALTLVVAMTVWFMITAGLRWRRS